jgi:4-hydroxy-tetrahydrodipicolinate reductase
MSTLRELRVLHVGLGQIGTRLARSTAERPRLTSVAGVDPNPELRGRSLAEVCGTGREGGARVYGSLGEALASGGPADVAFHAVGSELSAIVEQLEGLLAAGLNVVTTAEELIHPYERSPALAARLDETAKKHGVSLFAAGINPGFLMDRLPAYVSSVCTRVDSVEVERLVDLGARRIALRRKMGVGETLAAVGPRVASRQIGHVGLLDSLRYLAAELDWPLERVSQSLRPVVATARVEKAGETVGIGDVLGMEEVAEGVAQDGRRIRLHLTMRLDAPEPHDEIRIGGEPPIVLRFVGGVAGDLATVATVMNAAGYVVGAPPGLIAHLPLPAGT